MPAIHNAVMQRMVSFFRDNGNCPPEARVSFTVDTNSNYIGACPCTDCGSFRRSLESVANRYIINIMPLSRFPNLHTLRIIGTSVGPSAFDRIGELPLLRELTLDDKKTTMLPWAICLQTSLQKLWIRNMALPVEFNNLINLVRLVVEDSGQHLHTFPVMTALTKLSFLDVKCSSVYALPVLCILLPAVSPTCLLHISARLCFL